MKYLSAICLSAAFCLATNGVVRAQGDSDPGMSTLGAMRTTPDVMIAEDEFENDKVHFSIGHTFATGASDIKYNITHAEVRVPVQRFGYFDVKLPFQATSGNLANIGNLGDLFVTYTQVIRPEYMMDWEYQITGGTRIGLSTADRQDIHIRSLPMDYQSSLGSTDIIVGAHAKYKQYFVTSVGYQQPVFRYNENGYDRRAVNNDLIYSGTDYEISRKLYRYGDVMARVEGMYATKSAGIAAGPLLFYHLHNDLYTDRLGREVEIESAGFTANAVGNIFLRFGRYAQIKVDVTGSVPLIRRDHAPDGLRRDWMIMPRFTYFFGQRTLLF